MENIATFDFSSLYTSIPHDKLKERMAQAISDAYEGEGRKCISVHTSAAGFVNNLKSKTKDYTKEQSIDMVNYLIDNCYVTCGDSLFLQKIGMPLGTDCALFLANLF